MLISQTNHVYRNRLTISGIVQGVGFRPYVYSLAKTYGLAGFVRNLGGKLQIEIQGSVIDLDRFVNNLITNAPSLSSVKELQNQIIPISNEENDFVILPSLDDNDDWQSVASDSATCSECLYELFDENDRRFHYPFINCVNCGPRFTVINKLPYDRPYTTMSPFEMCNQCLSEYKNPLGRRFHAQANACGNCGPKLTFVSLDKEHFIQEEDKLAIINLTLAHLSQGEIVALKGLGGFHLMCDATNESAVNNLRVRKKRISKPFALMMSDLTMVKRYCSVSSQEEALLNSHRAPIVLLKKLAHCGVVDNITPGHYQLGIMLPYTPIHHLISNAFGKPLVMTSGNISEEPIVIDNKNALKTLAQVADCFLLNDREIAARYDDSVVRISNKASVIIRRSRGYAPEPLLTACRTNKTILSFGAQLKNTFCFFKGDQVFVSPHIGDLHNIETEDHFDNTLNKYRQLFRLKEEILACDLHPDYTSSRLAVALAEKEKLPLIRVQHHHAHIVSCMVEHKLSKPVIGIAFDGAGYGLDGSIWGGEFLIAQLDHFRRFACFEPIRMPGGEQAIRNPWRMALAYIFDQEQSDQYLFKDYLRNLEMEIGLKSVDLVCQQIKQRFNSPLTSSCGRLFDAVSSILGICHQANYEGEAAIRLEAVAMQEENRGKEEISQTAYPYSIIINGDRLLNNDTFSPAQASYHISTKDMLKQIALDKLSGIKTSSIARRFHYTLAEIVSDLCCRIRNEESINKVCFSGGVFQNYLLCQDTVKILQSNNFSVFSQEKIPANDGGISLGQAVIAAAQTGHLNW